MKLQRLEISGFKSFRDKVSLDFTRGISAIVGPNGCGKSNIVDAVRWVMGEQRVKSLRGKKMDDVIFGGSQDAPPVGMAEVHMTLACAEGMVFPGQYASCAEVAISRKIYRDGESEYAINGVPCRLLDVREFFMGTGVGARSYSLVEQNSVATMVEAKPEDRRAFIEEAAGISKYKNRKEAAIRKMEATQQNLVRLGDVLREVKSQLNAVARQAKRAEQYRALRGAIRERETALALHAYGDLREEGRTLTASRRALELQELEMATSLDGLEASREATRADILEQETVRAKCQEDLFAAKNDIRLHEQGIEFAKTKMADLQVRIAQDRLDMESGRQRLSVIAAERERLAGAMASLEQQIGQTRRDIDEAQKRLEQFRTAEQEQQKALEAEKGRYVGLASEKSRLRNMTANLAKSLEDLKRRSEREGRELEENQQRLDRAVAQREALAQTLTNLEQQQASLAEARRKAAEGQEQAREDLAAVEERIAETKDALGRKSSRLLSLKEFHEGYAWCNDATKNLMKARKAGNGDAEGPARLLGLVADHLTVSPAYEAAVEAVLGEKLQYVVVEHAHDAVQTIDYLRTAALGRTSFVPLRLRTSEPSHRGEHLREAVPLLDHVKVSDDYRPIAEYLLGDVLLIPNLRAGLSLWQQNGFHGTFVTPDGDTISPHGVLTGGSQGGGQRTLLKDRREIRELETEVRELSAALQTGTAEKGRLAALRDQWRDELARAAAETHKTELAINGGRKDAERLDADRRRLEQQVQVLTFNRDSLEAERKDQEKTLAETETAIAALVCQESEFDSRVEDLRRRWEAMRKDLELHDRQLTERRVLLASLEEKQRSAAKERELLDGENAALADKVETKRRDAESCQAQFEQGQRQAEEDRTALAGLYEACAALESAFQEKTAAAKALDEALNAWDAKIREARRDRDDIADQLRQKDLSIKELELQTENLCRMIAEKYDADLAVMVESFERLSEEALEVLERDLRKDRQTAEAFGEVNLLAIEEYDQLKERHDFLTAQSADLNASLDALQRTIARINKISRERFAETFEAVNRCFQDVFARIFPGGKGELRLTDESDLLETGVDIEIQIPGKRLQSISLLSGGEKSLAALALILAICLYRPTPFLILDEVDAALDESNVVLFTRLVREIAGNSQVIVVTHNKRTMEMAEKLYGVTMHKKGISTTVSVSLH